MTVAGSGLFPALSAQVWRLTAVIFSVCLLLCISGGAAIDCYRCSSVNGSEPRCHDPFHANYSDLLAVGCRAGRKQRNGLFPANACIKLTGYYVDDDTLMTIRDCAVDSATLTIDTELTRMSHCGSFEFQDRYVHGCIAACDYDGCNGAHQPAAVSRSPLVTLALFALVHGQM